MNYECVFDECPKVPGSPGCAISLEAEVHPWIRLNRYLLSDVTDVWYVFFGSGEYEGVCV